eukprot:1161671-Pelagomonas_calceolata.AAC.29
MHVAGMKHMINGQSVEVKRAVPREGACKGWLECVSAKEGLVLYCAQRGHCLRANGGLVL